MQEASFRREGDVGLRKGTAVWRQALLQRCGATHMSQDFPARLPVSKQSCQQPISDRCCTLNSAAACALIQRLCCQRRA